METREELERRVEFWWDQYETGRKRKNSLESEISGLRSTRRVVADSCIIGVSVSAISASITYFFMKVLECLPL